MAIRSLYGQSYKDLAAEFNVSYEAVRQAVRSFGVSHDLSGMLRLS